LIPLSTPWRTVTLSSLVLPGSPVVGRPTKPRGADASAGAVGLGDCLHCCVQLRPEVGVLGQPELLPIRRGEFSWVETYPPVSTLTGPRSIAGKRRNARGAQTPPQTMTSNVSTKRRREADCWRLAAVDALDMVERFGADATVGQVRRQAVCRVCHARGARALDRLKGMGKDRAWLPVPPRASR
jgi:hypothetical protein